jgi:nucleoside-diphosphate-sugar epimerase
VRILVTGGSGFLGSRVVAALVARGDDVISLQRRATTLPRGAAGLESDLTSLVPSRLPSGLDAIVHLAARLDDPFGVDRTLAELADTNVLGTLRLLEAAAVVGIGRFVHGSTGGVGANPPAGGLMREDDPAGPVNPYGLTKHLAEQAVRSYAWPFERVSLRYFAPYAREASNPLFRHLIAAIEDGAPIDVGSDGGPALDPIHADDAVAATLIAIEAPDLPPVINLAGPDAASVADIAGLLGAALRRAPVLRRGDEPSPSWVADIGLMRRHLREPRVGIAEGIRREFAR